MGIIAVLVGGTVVVINIFFRRGPEFDTKNTLRKVQLLVEKWRMEFDGVYPPSDLRRLRLVSDTGEEVKDLPNTLNVGIESLYQAFFWPGFKSDPQFGDAEIGNTDEDELRKAVNKLGTKALLEILDGYGNPFVYFHREDYERAAQAGVSLRVKDPDGQVSEVQAYPYRTAEGNFVNPTSFQLYSLGPDGQPNTEDDITAWGE